MYWRPYSSHTSHYPFQTPCLPWISYATHSKTDAWFMQDGRKSSLKHSIRFCVIYFSSLKQNFIAYHSSKVSSRPDCTFEIHQLWQSGFSNVYSNCRCSCSFKPEIIKIGKSSHKMYCNNILNFQASTSILKACTKKSGSLLNAPRIYIYIYIYIYMCIYIYICVCVCVCVLRYEIINMHRCHILKKHKASVFFPIRRVYFLTATFHSSQPL